LRDELLDYAGTGMGVMEMSHRGKPFMAIARACELDLRELLDIPPSYRVLFMQGGARAQFGVVAQNLLRDNDRADYVINGDWGRLAFQEATKFGRVRIAASSEAQGFREIPPFTDWQVDPQAAYLHITSNETIHGVEFHQLPDPGPVTLVADLSSNIASRPMDLSRFGLIYASAQKNIGPAGLTLVMVRDELLGRPQPGTLAVNDYRLVAEHDSMLNTPPTFSWYVCGLVLRWMKAEGGLAAIGERNARKAALLYDYLDSQDFYANRVRREYRSLMNVPFTLADPSQDGAFLAGAESAGLSGLKGHRLLGGMRASLYNAMPLAGVEALLGYMKEFVRVRA
jgi:phosphoserine aminotransferase